MFVKFCSHCITHHTKIARNFISFIVVLSLCLAGAQALYTQSRQRATSLQTSTGTYLHQSAHTATRTTRTIRVKRVLEFMDGDRRVCARGGVWVSNAVSVCTRLAR